MLSANRSLLVQYHHLGEDRCGMRLCQKNALQESSSDMTGREFLRYFIKLYFLTCTPILATVYPFFSAVGQWNSYQDTLIYVTEQKLYSLQYLLYTYINQASSLAAMVKNSGTAAVSSAALATQQTGTSIRMTVSVIVVLPILLYVSDVPEVLARKGIMIGSVKG
ncbi:MAG: hypothetical protein ACLTKE_04030 [Coprococcus sp.]